MGEEGRGSVRELQAVIENLAEQLHRAVAIDDPQIRLLAHTAHDERVDQHRITSIMTLRPGVEIAQYVFGLGIRTATEPVRVPRNPDMEALGRLCIPIRCQNVLLGYLWLIDDDESLTAAEIETSVATADVAGEILFRNRLLDDLRRARERQLVFDLITPGSPGHGRVTQHDLEAVGLTSQLACRMVVVHAPFDEERLDTEAGELSLEAVLRRAVRKLKHVRPLVATRRGGRGYVLAAYRGFEDPLEQLHEFGREVSAELSETLPGHPDVLVGIGPEEADVMTAAVTHRRAEGVIDICQAVADFGPVAAWEDLGIYKLLQQLPVEELNDVAIPRGLRALLDTPSDRWLVDTLDTYLDAAGNAQESAKRLHIHRATLYYRLTRIEELTGMSLADGQDRLALHLGVKFAKLVGHVAAEVADHPTESAHHAGGSVDVDRS